MEIEITKSIYDKMVSHQFVVSILGSFDQSLLLSLINITDRKLTGLEVQENIKRKIFHFMVECSQNLLKTEQVSSSGQDNIFLIAQENDVYSVFLGTRMQSDKLEPILSAIEHVNRYSSQDVKKKYYEELTSTAIVNNDMLLLSLLSIYKRTREKINYDLIKISDTDYFMAFKMSLAN